MLYRFLAVAAVALLLSGCEVGLFFGGLPFASIVLARRFIASGAVGWAIYSAASGIGMFVINASTGASPGTAGMFPDVAGLLQRIAIVLGSIEGHDTREVAALLGVPHGTVKSRLFLARKRLRELLDA